MFSKPSSYKFFEALLIVVLLAGAAGVTPARAASIVVNSDQDTVANDGNCTLREAIQEANNGADTDCPGSPSAGDDTITFSVSGTITLGSTLPNIVSGQGALTIDGAGQTITISGNNAVRVMTVNSGASLTLNSVTIANGRCNSCNGGGIYNQGTLTVINSTFSSNTADYGGGIFNYGSTLDIKNSAFSNNSAVFSGGGIRNDSGTLMVTNSTFSGNTAPGLGGGIFNYTSGILTVTNSTFSGNSATGDFGFGGGIYNVGTVAALKNTIVANSPSGGNCSGTITDNGNNLDSGSTCGFSAPGSMSNTDPNLGALAGSPAYFPLNAGSPAIDAGDNAACAAAPVNNQSQNGLTRPQDGKCDIGAYESPDTTPTVLSIVRANANPTANASVNFTVTFSEPVTGVDSGDFSLAVSGISGAAITGVSGADDNYTVTVNTGTGNGTLGLNLTDDDSITDGTTPLGGTGAGNGDFTGETYTVNKTATFKSTGAQDGWIRESSETSNTGGILNSGATTLRLGDDALNRQYRAILSFNTSSLPDTAIVTKVTLKVKRQGVTGGGNPVTMFSGFKAYIKQGVFGTSALALGDFNAAASKTVGPLTVTPSGGWYSLNLTSGKTKINKTGLTQIRLQFALDDNNNFIANILNIYSGNAGAASRPQLIVEYYLP